MEFTVLNNAKRAAKALSLTTHDSIDYHQKKGILFRYRQCNVCHKFLDDEARLKKAKASNGTIVLRNTQFNDDQEDD